MGPCLVSVSCEYLYDASCMTGNATIPELSVMTTANRLLPVARSGVASMMSRFSLSVTTVQFCSGSFSLLLFSGLV